MHARPQGPAQHTAIHRRSPGLPAAHRLVRRVALGAALACGLAACGGGDDDTTTPVTPVTPSTTTAVQVTVVDGLLKGALVCLDANDNGSCDAGETQATSLDNGVATLQVPNADVGKDAVLAQVPVGAVDADHGAVPTAFLLKAPADQAAVVSPLTTLVAAQRQLAGSTSAEAEQVLKGRLGLSGSLFANHVGKTDADARLAGDIARLLVMATQQVHAATAGAKDLSGQALSDAERALVLNQRLLDGLPAVAAAAAAPAVAAATGAAKTEALRAAAAVVAGNTGISAGTIAAAVARARPLTADRLLALYVGAGGRLDTAALAHMESVAGELTGAWSLSGNPDAAAQVFFFFANGDYVMVDPVGDTENNCGPAGVERGRVSYTKAGGEFSLLSVSVDTNLCAGLHDTTVPDAEQFNRKFANFNIAADGKTFTAVWPDGSAPDTVYKLTR